MKSGVYSMAFSRWDLITGRVKAAEAAAIVDVE